MTSMAKAEKVRCRQIEAADFEAVAALLTEGFPARTLPYWRGALAALKARRAPDGYPQYGYLLAGEAGVVGVLLLIFTEGPAGKVRCNVSSWYVDPDYRVYAPALVSSALKFKDVTYLNVSPAPNTWPILEAQGYRRYGQGQFVGFPALSLKGLGVRVRRYDPKTHDHRLPAEEAALLKDHVAVGCLAAICETNGEARPLVFMHRPVKGLRTVAMQVVYCRDTAHFSDAAGAVGRFLLRRGVAVVFCDEERPLKGQIGQFFKDRAPKYYRGADRPRLNDLAYTEAVLFGA